MTIIDKDAQRRPWCMFWTKNESDPASINQDAMPARLIFVDEDEGAPYIDEFFVAWEHCRECTPEELAEHGLTQPPKPWAERVTQWAIDRNLIEGSKPKDQLAKAIEELGELAAGIIRGDMAKIEDSIVDEVVVMRIIAAQYGIDWDQCLEKGWDQIKDRKGWTIDGVFHKEVSECIQ